MREYCSIQIILKGDLASDELTKGEVPCMDIVWFVRI